MRISIEADTDGVRDIVRAFDRVAEKTVKQAHVSAVNKTMSKYQTAVRRSLSKAAGVPIKAIKRRFKLHRAKRRKTQARLFIGTVPVAVRDAGFRQLARGISYRGPGGRIRDQSAFVAQTKSGHESVFRRRGQARLPIDELRIPIFAAARTAAQVHRKVLREFGMIFDREFAFRVRREFNKL